MICKTCKEIHGRDTNFPIRCPTCGLIAGCFWHHQEATRHIRECGQKGKDTVAADAAGGSDGSLA
jgi:hypothetical protein